MKSTRRMYIYNLFDIPRILSNCLKTVMRNYENDLLEELRNNNYGEENISDEDSDEELSQIWSLSGNSSITDLGDTEIKILEENSSESNRNRTGEIYSSSDKYMVFIDNSNENNQENTQRNNNRLGLRDVTNEHISQSEPRLHPDDDADDEDESDTSTGDSDSEDDMFDVCIRESMYRRRRVLPYYGRYRDRKYADDDDDDDDDDNYKRPLTITPIKRRYTVAESLRVRVLKMEAAKSMASLFKSKCSTDS